MVRRSGNVSRGTATGCIFSPPLAFGLRMRGREMALKYTTWKAQTDDLNVEISKSNWGIVGRGFYPSLMHAHSSSPARDDAPATPTQVISQSEINLKKVAMYMSTEHAEQIIEYVLMTSRPPCWRSKQYRVGHIGGVYKSSGN